METILAHRELHIERKYVIIELRENERGRFLKICETAAGRRNIVIVPDSGMAEFARALVSILGAHPVVGGDGKRPVMPTAEATRAPQTAGDPKADGASA